MDIKKIGLTFAFAAFAAFASFAQIHSSGGQVYLRDGDISSYTNPDIYVAPKYFFLTDSWSVTCTVVDPSIDIQEIVEFVLPFKSSELDVYTGTGTETASLIDVTEQAVIAYLQSVTANGGITFSH
jgi:hypothetical protein